MHAGHTVDMQVKMAPIRCLKAPVFDQTLNSILTSLFLADDSITEKLI